MTDYFALLNFPRSPWLDSKDVQERFLEMSAALHPDRVHSLGATEISAANQKFAELNTAATTLRDHKERLHHLLALETGAPHLTAQSISAEFVDFLTRIGQTCRDIDQFLGERSRASSPMLQAQLYAKGLDWSDSIAELQQQVGSVKIKAEAELQEIAQSWPAVKPFERLAALAHTFAMAGRWEAQLQERFAALAA